MLQKKQFLFLIFFLFSFLNYCQISDFKEKFELPSIVDETSGLLFLDGKIITHNDSGDAAVLYELDSVTGNLIRAVSIKQSKNVDWEDLAEDETHIYIGDFGNNNGDREDLRIYKILKSEFKNNSNATAQLISFSYEDQTNFNSSDSHNFDAEAFVVYENSLLIFTKNRDDLKTNVYKIPKTIGIHSAIKVSTANVQGLITGATLQNNNFMLCGYDEGAYSFLIFVSADRNAGDDIFNNGFDKYWFRISELGQGSQVEAITSFDDGKFYISREGVDKPSVKLNQALFEFKDDRTKVLSIEKNELDILNISPNPTSDKIFINSNKTILKTSMYNTLGKKVLEFNTYQKEINISHFSKGIYLLKIQFDDKKTVNRKIIKL